MGALGGILLDESVLFEEESSEDPRFLPGTENFLLRLQYSQLRIGIIHRENASFERVTFLRRVATKSSFDCFLLKESCMDDSANENLLRWKRSGESRFYVTSRKDENISMKFKKEGWTIVVKSCEGDHKMNDETLFINKLDEISFILCQFTKKAMRDASILVIGYVMKPSREIDFSKRGAFPAIPTQNGLMFLPLSFDRPLASQLKEVDVVIHKATDEILKIDLSSCIDLSERITYSKGMQELKSYVVNHPELCVIDQFNSIYPLVDRSIIQHILLGIKDVNTQNRRQIRGPNFLKVDSFNESNLALKLQEAGLILPSIVKPQVACGVSDAHSMAIIFRVEDFCDLKVPLPAIIQEYVEHSSLLFKFYVLGDKIFHVAKKSIPNSDVLLSKATVHGCKPIIFDSLRSLPLSKDDEPCSKVNKPSVDLELVTDAANWLRRRLKLSIFGFDVIIQEGSEDHVVVDVNYLPSFKEIPDDIAMPAFWDAIRSTYEKMKQGNRTPV